VSCPLDASFNALTELSISSFASREDIFHVMSQCVRVQKLYIDVGRIMIGPPLSHVMDIYLPHLSSLDVVSHSGFEGLMDGWNFPSLRSLWIRLEWKVYGEDEQGEQIAVGAPRWPQVAFQQFIM
jgi:hypothetical protein